jgi:hypothetical protein
MRDIGWILAVALALWAGFESGRTYRDDQMPEPWTLCVERCEEEDPEDNGQGCIDLECNPLLK